MKYKGRLLTLGSTLLIFITLYTWLQYMSSLDLQLGSSYTEQISSLNLKFVLVFTFILGSFIGFIGFKYDHYKYYAQIDPLTNIYNRRFIQYALPKLTSSSKRRHKKLSLFVIDINNFKDINDTWGHDKGDEVLKDIVEILIENTRKADIVGRWGGDEFIIIAPYTNRASAQSLKSRLQKKVAQHFDHKYLDLNISIGIATFPDIGLHQLIDVADQDMYHDKSVYKANKCITA